MPKAAEKDYLVQKLTLTLAHRSGLLAPTEQAPIQRLRLETLTADQLRALEELSECIWLEGRRQTRA